MASNKWHSFFFSCFDDPTFTKEMRQDIIDNFGEDHANQEYPKTWQEAFLMSGNCRFKAAAIREMEKGIIPGTRGFFERVNENFVRFIKDDDGWVTIFQEPIPRQQYASALDPCQGIQVDEKDKRKTDENGGQIFRVDNLEQVCEIRNRHEPDIIAEEIAMASTYYNQALCGVERNKERSVILNVMKIYDHYYSEERFDDEMGVKKRNAGWFTTASNKFIMISHLDQMMRECRLKLHSVELINQMKTFVRQVDGSCKAQEGCKDDLVMSAMICLQMCLCTPTRRRLRGRPDSGKAKDSWVDSKSDGYESNDNNNMLDRAFHNQLPGGRNYFNR